MFHTSRDGAIHHPPSQLQWLAARRAGRKLSWFIHAAIYLMVNAGLMALALHQGRHWAIYPAVFWGLGLLAHGASVWLLSSRSDWWLRMVEREKSILEKQARSVAKDNNTPTN